MVAPLFLLGNELLPWRAAAESAQSCTGGLLGGKSSGISRASGMGVTGLSTGATLGRPAASSRTHRDSPYGPPVHI